MRIVIQRNSLIPSDNQFSPSALVPYKIKTKILIFLHNVQCLKHNELSYMIYKSSLNQAGGEGQTAVLSPVKLTYLHGRRHDNPSAKVNYLMASYVLARSQSYLGCKNSYLRY